MVRKGADWQGPLQGASFMPCFLTRRVWATAYMLRAPAVRLGFALARRGAATRVSGGVRDLTLLKTTQSGYEGFLKDAMTALPDTRERMLASAVAATWCFSSRPTNSEATFAALLSALTNKFFGPARAGVYSPGMQATLYQMGSAALAVEPLLESITLRCPNIHFLPLLPAGIAFDNDVYVATSEPHGTIEATVGRTAQSPVTVARL